MINKENINVRELLENRFDMLNLQERKQRLIDFKILTKEDFEILAKETSLKLELADQLIENVIGCFPFPVALALNFVINQHDYIIPMVTEETSVVLAASKAANWVRLHGEITTKTIGDSHIGQIQIPKLDNKEKFTQKVLANKAHLIELANTEVAASLNKRGGGVKDLTLRFLSRDDGYETAVIHVMVNTKDAMGANIINQICEFLKSPIENLTNEKVGMCILSNLVDTKITQANIVIRNVKSRLGHAIEEGSLFAQIDPYRAATNNKGVMNGIDSVLIATGNDWRAVEAGVHAYAARSGQYKSITRWKMQGNDLHGLLEAPIIVGTVGGVTQLHPVAQICLKILGVKNANELAQVTAAVGLVQNLAALRALVTKGIVAGHMKLHLNNLAIAAGATSQELIELKPLLAKFLKEKNFISSQHIKNVLAELRKEKGG